MITADELWPILDAAGEEEVRRKVAQGAYGPAKLPLITEWLASKERQRGDVANRNRDARNAEVLKLSSEANSIARESNAISRRSNIASWVAVCISFVALLVAIAGAVLKTQE